MRRESADRPVLIRVGSLRLDPARSRVWRGRAGDSAVDSRVRPARGVHAKPGQVLSHHQLLDAAWNIGHDYRSNVIEVYVRYLREKIDRPFGVRSLETVRGVGYRLRRDGGI